MTSGEPSGDGVAAAGEEPRADLARDHAAGAAGEAPAGPGETPAGGAGRAAGEAAAETTGHEPGGGTAPERWLDEQAGPLVRPYVMTRGRTEPIRGTFDLISMVLATGPAAPDTGLAPEHGAVLRLCAQPVSVAEIAGHLRLPTVTVRVLLGDLLDRELIAVEEPRTETELADDDDMYQAVIDGLHAL